MINDFIRYIEAEKQYSKLTVRAYGDDIRQFLLYSGISEEEFTPNKVTHLDIRSWIMSLSEQGQSPRSINRRISSLKGLYRYLSQQGLTNNNPTLKIRSLKPAQRVVSVVGKDKMEQMSSSILEIGDEFDKERDDVIILLLYATGIRLSELIGIKIDDLSKDLSQIIIKGKGEKERIVVVATAIKDKIENYIKIRAEICLLSEKSLILSNKSRAISRTYVYKLVRERLGDLGLSGKRSPHVLRHTFATHLLNEGVGIETIKSLLGHSSLKSTQVYTHSSIGELIKSYKSSHPWAKDDNNK